jgi:hypothetical protein
MLTLQHYYFIQNMFAYHCRTRDDLSQMIEWAAAQEWSSGNVGLIGVSALAKNQYYTASKLLTEESANIL